MGTRVDSWSLQQPEEPWPSSKEFLTQIGSYSHSLPQHTNSSRKEWWHISWDPGKSGLYSMRGKMDTWWLSTTLLCFHHGTMYSFPWAAHGLSSSWQPFGNPLNLFLEVWWYIIDQLWYPAGFTTSNLDTWHPMVLFFTVTQFQHQAPCRAWGCAKFQEP